MHLPSHSVSDASSPKVLPQPYPPATGNDLRKHQPLSCPQSSHPSSSTLQAELSVSDCWSVDELLTPPAKALDGTGAVTSSFEAPMLRCLKLHGIGTQGKHCSANDAHVYSSEASNSQTKLTCSQDRSSVCKAMTMRPASYIKSFQKAEASDSVLIA